MTIAVHLRLPEDLAAKVRSESKDLDKEVTEAYALQLFREGRITHHELAQALGLDRFETDAYLKAHNVFEGSLTMDDLEEESAVFLKNRGKSP